MYLSIYLSIYRSVDLSIYLSIHPSIAGGARALAIVWPRRGSKPLEDAQRPAGPEPRAAVAAPPLLRRAPAGVASRARAACEAADRKRRRDHLDVSARVHSEAPVSRRLVSAISILSCCDSPTADFLPCRSTRVGGTATRCRSGQLHVRRGRGVRDCHAHVCHTADSVHAQAQAAAPAARRCILRLAGTGPAGCCRRLRLAAVAASAEGVPIRRRNDCDQPRATTLRARTPRMPCHTYSQSHAVPQSCHAAAAPCVRGARTSL